MNYRINIDPVGIFSTGAAVDNATVFGSLKMARAALDTMVDAEIVGVNGGFGEAVLSLKRMAAERIRDLRAQRKIALKVREADLKSDETIPVLSPPPAAPAAAVSTESGSPARKTAADTPEPRAVAQGGEQATAATENGGDAPSSPGSDLPSNQSPRATSDDARAGEPIAGTGDADPFEIPDGLKRPRPAA